MISTVAVGVDESPTAAEAVKMAAELARRFDARLVLLTAYRHADGAGATDAHRRRARVGEQLLGAAARTGRADRVPTA